MKWNTKRIESAIRISTNCPHHQPAQGAATHPTRAGADKGTGKLLTGGLRTTRSSPAHLLLGDVQAGRTVKNTETTEIPAFKSFSPALCCHRVHPVQRCPQKGLNAKFPAPLFSSLSRKAIQRAGSAYAASEVGESPAPLGRLGILVNFIQWNISSPFGNLAQPPQHQTGGGKVTSIYLWTTSQK